MNRSTLGLPVHHQLQELTQTHVHGVSDAIQPSCPLLFPSPAFGFWAQLFYASVSPVSESHPVDTLLGEGKWPWQARCLLGAV